MAIETTFSVIKPDAVEKGLIHTIQKRFRDGGLDIVACKPMLLNDRQARALYAVHKDKDFFEELIGFMTSGPIVVQALRGENAILQNREIMKSIRKDFSTDVMRCCVHGSDAPETAMAELALFFSYNELNQGKDAANAAVLNALTAVKTL